MANALVDLDQFGAESLEAAEAVHLALGLAQLGWIGERVLDGLGQHLAQSCVDDLKYRREGERNHLTQSKRIGK